MLLFDTMKKQHGLGKRSAVAAGRGDFALTGKYSVLPMPRSAHNIIMSSEIMGLSHLEREIVAGTVLYNSYPLAD